MICEAEGRDFICGGALEAVYVDNIDAELVNSLNALCRYDINIKISRRDLVRTVMELWIINMICMRHVM